MNASYLVLVGRIRQDLNDLAHVINRAQRAGRVARTSQEDADLYVDAAALNLHDFYTGLERLFYQITLTVDGSAPASQEWHRDLLRQMCIDIPGLRPRVLSSELCAALDEFMRFRHVVRNVYAFNLDSARVAQLVDEANGLIIRLTAEMQRFADFLEQTGQE